MSEHEKKTAHPTAKGVACVLFSVLIWSGWMVVSRYSVRGSLSPYDITAIRFGVAGLLLMPVALRRGLAIGPWGLRGGLLLACLIGAPYSNIAVEGMKFAPASHASTVINGAMLTLTTLVGIHGLREKTSPIRLVGVAFSLGGIGCMLAAKSAGSSQQWFGHLCFIVSGLIWAGYALLVRAWRADAMQAAAAVCVFSLLFYLPLYLLFAHSHIGLGNWREVAFQCVYQGAMTGVIALVSFNHGIRLLGASQASAFIPLVPVFSTLLAIPVLQETPSALEWVGVAAVSGGVFLASGALGARGKDTLQLAEASEAGAMIEEE